MQWFTTKSTRQWSSSWHVFTNFPSIIACKSDTAEPLKTWFSVKNFTEKLRLVYHFNNSKIGSIHTPTACLLKKNYFLSICIHNCQSDLAAYMKKAVKAITDVKKSADVKPLKIKNAQNQADNFAIFQWSFFYWKSRFQ